MLTEKFKKALVALGGMEGGYGNDPDDPGGETLYGWSRRYHPKLAFWSKVDTIKQKYGGATKAAVAEILADTEIKQISDEAYKTEYWDIWNGDNVPYSLGLELFEFGINCGSGGCAKALQRVLNGLNYDGKFGSDLKVDGAFGPASNKRYMDMVKAGYAKAIQFGVNSVQGNYYLELTEKDTGKRKFYRGWIQNRTSAVYSEN